MLPFIRQREPHHPANFRAVDPDGAHHPVKFTLYLLHVLLSSCQWIFALFYFPFSSFFCLAGIALGQCLHYFLK